jgi:hypothetical protein
MKKRDFLKMLGVVPFLTPKLAEPLAEPLIKQTLKPNLNAGTEMNVKYYPTGFYCVSGLVMNYDPRRGL